MTTKNNFPNYIGFDTLFDQFDRFLAGAKSIPGFPPYNVKKTGDNTYAIEVAVAGFSKSDIDVTIEGNTLTVSGEVKSTEPSDYIYKGIAERSFERKFTLADNVVVKSGEIVNGMLKIGLEAQAAAAKALRLELK